MLRWILLPAVEPTHRIVTLASTATTLAPRSLLSYRWHVFLSGELVARAIVNVRGAVALNFWIAAPMLIVAPMLKVHPKTVFL